MRLTVHLCNARCGTAFAHCTPFPVCVPLLGRQLAEKYRSIMCLTACCLLYSREPRNNLLLPLMMITIVSISALGVMFNNAQLDHRNDQRPQQPFRLGATFAVGLLALFGAAIATRSRLSQCLVRLQTRGLCGPHRHDTEARRDAMILGIICIK